jgi:hypothetical protein
MIDLFSATRRYLGIAPVSMSATTKTGIVDRLGISEVLFGISFGALGGTYNGTDFWTITIEDSDTVTDGDFAIVTDSSHVSGAFTDISTGVWKVINAEAIRDAVKSAVHAISYHGTKRYCRLVFTKAASGPATLVAVHAVGGSVAQVGTTGLLPDLSAGNTAVAAVAAS